MQELSVVAGLSRQQVEAWLSTTCNLIHGMVMQMLGSVLLPSKKGHVALYDRLVASPNEL
jgi:hypothetical protein